MTHVAPRRGGSSVSFSSSEILVGRMLMRERDRRGGEVANYLHVTRFIMLAPIARNTLRSFRGVIHRGVITNAYCGSAEAREPARPANFVVRERYHFAVSLPPPLSPSLFLVSISILFPSLPSRVTPGNNYNGRSDRVVVGGTLMRLSPHARVCESI